MAAGSTYSPIATYTAPSSQASYTFTSIPGTYTDLVLVVAARSDAAYPETAGFLYVGNGSIDTGNNYSTTRLLGTGSSASSARQSNRSGAPWDSIPGATSASGNFCTTIIHLNNFSNTTTNKTFLIRSNEPNNYVEATVGLWRSTFAIDNIRITADAGSLVSGSTFTLYGILSA